MGDVLAPGMTFEFSYTVPADKTVPHLYADAPEDPQGLPSF